MGMLSDLLTRQFQVKTRPNVNPLVAAVGVAAIPVANNNPDRVGLTFINLSVNVIYVSPDPNVSAAIGIRLDANGGQLTLVWWEDFELVGHEWYAIAAGANSAFYTLETLGVR